MKFQKSDDTLKSFEALNLPPLLTENLAKLNIGTPTEIQAQTFPIAILGESAIVVGQTGTGKTLAFCLPICLQLLKEPDSRALIMAPSREVAEQIHKVLGKLLENANVTHALIISGIPNKQQVSALKKKPRVIVATPGRLNEHLITNKLLLQGTTVVVIDEADRMLDQGFSKQLDQIRKTMRGQWQTLMFSASFDQSVEVVAEKFMNSVPFLVKPESAETPVAGLDQTVYFVDQGMKNDKLAKELKSIKGSTIIFVGNQPECESIGSHLMKNGFSSDFIHGAMSPGHRNRVLKEFREKKIQIMVTTDLLARGLDVEHITCVVNYNVPQEPEDFLHRIGRTARAGKSGQAISFITPRDAEMFKKIQKYLVGAREIRLNS